VPDPERVLTGTAGRLEVFTPVISVMALRGYRRGEMARDLALGLSLLGKVKMSNVDGHHHNLMQFNPSNYKYHARQAEGRFDQLSNAFTA
jgi:hypothetical protein